MGSRQSLVAAPYLDKKLDRFYPKQKNTLKQINLTYYPGPVWPRNGDGSKLAEL